MGQEAKCTAWLGDQASDGRALLETDHLLFRGEFRLKLMFSELTAVEAANGLLTLVTTTGTATFELGALASKWAEKIKNPKRLIDKLGVKPGDRVAVINVMDEPFRQQLSELTTEISEGAVGTSVQWIFLGVEAVPDLEQFHALKERLEKTGAIWVVHPKGKPHIKDIDVLSAGRAAGLVDTKVAGFSATHSALKFVIPASAR